MTSENTQFEGWAILELMGHRRLAGYVKAEELAGVGLLRLDVPADDKHDAATQYYHPNALYCLTPTTEEIARALARSMYPEPVTRWDLPRVPAPSEEPHYHRCIQCDRLTATRPNSRCLDCEEEDEGDGQTIAEVGNADDGEL